MNLPESIRAFICVSIFEASSCAVVIDIGVSNVLLSSLLKTAQLIPDVGETGAHLAALCFKNPSQWVLCHYCWLQLNQTWVRALHWLVLEYTCWVLEVPISWVCQVSCWKHCWIKQMLLDCCMGVLHQSSLHLWVTSLGIHGRYVQAACNRNKVLCIRICLVLHKTWHWEPLWLCQCP